MGQIVGADNGNGNGNGGDGEVPIRDIIDILHEQRLA